MKYYLAPMEGITTYIYRSAYEHHFHNVDRYFTPFVVNKRLSTREQQDLLPEHNKGMDVVPQILTNRAEDFLEVAKEIADMGYQTVNLNLGCPSGTVVAKKRGAGFLALPEELDAFLAEIFEKCPMKISIKTRIGMEDETEWERLISIYQKYPMEELIVHPRTQKDFYKYPPRMDAYEMAESVFDVPLCYNGELNSVEKMRELTERFPNLDCVMLGRGILKNPGLVGEIRKSWGEAEMTEEAISKETFRSFHDEIYYGYREIMSGDRNTLYKMKELWSYMGQSFTNPEKYMKKIRKTERLVEYECIVASLFREQELQHDAK